MSRLVEKIRKGFYLTPGVSGSLPRTRSYQDNLVNLYACLSALIGCSNFKANQRAPNMRSINLMQNFSGFKSILGANLAS